MSILALLCAVCDLVRASASLVGTPAGPPLRQEGITTVRSVNFVEVIKQDLKRNNDDYKERALELASRLLSTRPALEAVTSLPTLLQNNKRIRVKSNRRNNDQYYEIYDFRNQSPNMDTKSSTDMATETLRLRTLSPGPSAAAFPILNNHSRVVSSQKPFLNLIQDMKQKHQQISPQERKRNKIVKFKQFIEKNKELIKQYMNTKTEVQTQRAVLRRLPPRRQRHDDALPDPEVLDMAPARGGRVFRHRLKGRLCHRHVLMPEGPKYDSAGHWYVPAYEGGPQGHGGQPRRGRDYAVTRAPLLLLPRCCNCCKKSVLGCQ